MKAKLTFAAVAIGVLTACGGDDGSDEAAPTATAAPQDAVARSYLLTVADFPAGWAENPGDDGSDTPDAAEKCIDDYSLEEGRVGYAESGDFEKGNSGSVSHAVAIYESPEKLNATTEALNRRTACLVDVFNDGKADDGDAAYSDAKYAPMSFPKVGDDTHAYRMTVHVKAKKQTGLGSEGDIYFDFVLVFRGSVGFSLVDTDVFSPFDSTMLADLAEKAEAKIK